MKKKSRKKNPVTLVILRASVKRGPDTCGWRMRSCGWENADRKMRITKKVTEKKNENCGWQKKKKTNKLTIKERNLSFQSLSHGWTLHLHTERDANSWHSFVPCNSFH